MPGSVVAEVKEETKSLVKYAKPVVVRISNRKKSIGGSLVRYPKPTGAKKMKRRTHRTF